MDCDMTFNKLKQLPFTFLNIQLGFISLQRLNTQITSLFLQMNILEDQDLVNMVIALLLNRPTCHPDILVNELKQFFGSQTRVGNVFHCLFLEIHVRIMEVFDPK